MTELEAKDEHGSDDLKPSYYVRLGCLSAKLRQRAYSRAVARIRDGKQRSMGFISELHSTVDLVGLTNITSYLWIPVHVNHPFKDVFVEIILH